MYLLFFSFRHIDSYHTALVSQTCESSKVDLGVFERQKSELAPFRMFLEGKTHQSSIKGAGKSPKH